MYGLNVRKKRVYFSMKNLISETNVHFTGSLISVIQL